MRQAAESITKLLRSYTKSAYQTETVKVNNRDISYLTAGKGPAILLLHGANIGWIQWAPNIDTLTQRFKVYAIDLPGSGQSSELDYFNASFQNDYVKTIQQFIHEVIKEDLHALIGHSFSGWISLKANLPKPLSKKLVLINPVGFTRHIRPQHYLLSFKTTAKLLSKTVMKPNRKNMNDFFLSVFHKKDIDPLFIDAYCDMISDRRHPFLFIGSLMSKFRLKKELLFSEIPKDQPETLLIHSQYDPFMRNKDFLYAKQMLNCNAIQIPDSGHVPTIEDADLLNKTLSEFL